LRLHKGEEENHRHETDQPTRSDTRGARGGAARRLALKIDGQADHADVITPTARARESAARLAAVYGIFVLLVVVYTWPLSANLSSHLRQWLDVHYFVWELGWVARRVFEAPRSLFNGNILYPHGLTLAYSDLMLVPALTTFAPVYAITRNPILAHNVTIILFQALAGWAGYYAARQLTGSSAAGWVAGIAFALSPIRTGYYHFAHMQLSFAVPLTFLAFSRFLQRQAVLDLAIALFFLWCQMVTVMYFGIPLIVMLALLTAGVLLLRPRGWQLRTLVALLVGGVVFAILYLPFAWPYLVARSEMGFERSLAEAQERAADLLTYLDAGPENRLYHYRLANSGTHPDIFPGFTVYALALAALFLSPRRAVPALPRWHAWTRRAVGWGLAVTLAVIGVFLLTGGGVVRVHGLRLRMTGLERPAVILFGLGAVWLAVEGRAWVRAGDERSLTPREWATLLGLLTFFFVLLSLGPVMHVAGKPVGTGIYTRLYDVFLPMRALRVTHRLGFIVMFLIGLLAAFGLASVRGRLASSRFRRVLALAPLVLLAEYLPYPLRYDVIRWDEPRPVYRWLAQQPGDFVIVEWPSFRELPDATYGMWSLLHRKRIVNGSAGFDPPFTQEVRNAVGDLPDTGSLSVIRSVYPLRFVLVHMDLLHPDERKLWERFEQRLPEGLGIAGHFGGTIAFELRPVPEESRRWERNFSTDLVAAHPQARVDVSLVREDPEIDPTVRVEFNGRRLTELPLRSAPTALRLALPPPYPRVDRDVLSLEVVYRIRPHGFSGPAHLIGATGVHSPVDLAVTSAGKTAGSTTSIQVNGVDVSLNRRGYNVAVIDPRSGQVTERDGFDTFLSRAESARLADHIARVPLGFIVVAAIRDDGVGQLTNDAVQALRSLGGKLDPRGTLFVSHLVIGVKGVPPGSAVEAFGPERLTRFVGRQRGDLLVTRNFQLE
jgi:Interleukin-like EMT inducer